ncbi:MAG: DUF3108 domain-containing protein [Thermodesulfobacteriota bacterium]
MMRAIWIIFLCLALGLGPAGKGGAAPEAPRLLEDLEYRVSLGVWQDMARVHLRLFQVEAGRYRAEVTGAAQGAWKLLNRWLPERYEAEMVLESGRLKPLVFREVFEVKGRRIFKEYRFDYTRGVLEMWLAKDGREPVKDWQRPLKEQVYDPFTLFYNSRLGAMGPLAPGQILKVATIPNPEPREMVINLGPQTPQGWKVMLSVKTKAGADKYGPYFLLLTPQKVPQTAWMRVLGFAKLSGELLNPGEIRKDGLPGAPQLSRQQGASGK